MHRVRHWRVKNDIWKWHRKFNEQNENPTKAFAPLLIFERGVSEFKLAASRLCQQCRWIHSNYRAISYCNWPLNFHFLQSTILSLSSYAKPVTQANTAEIQRKLMCFVMWTSVQFYCYAQPTTSSSIYTKDEAIRPSERTVNVYRKTPRHISQ